MGGIIAHYDVMDNFPLPLGRLAPVDHGLVLWWPRFLAANQFPRFCDTRPIMYDRDITTGFSARLDFSPALTADQDFDKTTNPIASSITVPPPHAIAWCSTPIAVEVAQSVLTESATAAGASLVSAEPASVAESQAPPSMVFVGAFSFSLSPAQHTNGFPRNTSMSVGTGCAFALHSNIPTSLVSNIGEPPTLVNSLLPCFSRF